MSSPRSEIILSTIQDTAEDRGVQHINKYRRNEDDYNNPAVFLNKIVEIAACGHDRYSYGRSKAHKRPRP